MAAFTSAQPDWQEGEQEVCQDEKERREGPQNHRMQRRETAGVEAGIRFQAHACKRNQRKKNPESHNTRIHCVTLPAAPGTLWDTTGS
jgi:hypothetical protein